MSKVFRRLIEKDAEKFHHFLTAAYADNLKYGIRFPATFATAEDIKNHLADNLCYILEQDKEIITSCSLWMPWSPNPGPDVFPHLGWISTSPKYKRQGYSTQMLAWIEQEILIKQFKTPSVTLNTAEEHPWLVGMYEKHGYAVYDKRILHANYVTVFMRKSLF